MRRVVFLVSIVTAACGTSDHTSGDEPAPEPECPPVVEAGGGGIQAPPDGAALCPFAGTAAPADIFCNYQTSAGCASAESCLPGFSQGSLEITPSCVAAGDGAAGEPCTAWAIPSDCAPGHFCADGVCRQMCCGADWSACNGETSCFRPLFIRLMGDSASVDVPAEVGLCFPTGTCDVLDPDSCAGDDGRACKIVDPTGAQACVPSGPGTAGQECASPEFCGPGLSCVGEVCRRLCRAEACGAPACPDSEGVCVHLDRDPPGVGECTLDFAAD